MKDQLVKFETAKLAKEKGFEGPHLVLFPTQSLLQRWIREKHGYYIVVIPTVTSNWTFKIVKVISEIDNDILMGLKSVSDLPPYKEVNGYDYSTYEESLEEALQEALNLI